MMTTSAPLSIYQERIGTLSTQLKEYKKKRNLIAWGRFACIVAAIAAFYYLLAIDIRYATIGAAFFLVIFFRLLLLAVNNNTIISNIQLLIIINEDEINIAGGHYLDRPNGGQLSPTLHDYAHDLDIFGRASLYQYINRTTSEQGNIILAQWLLSPVDKETILLRQQAVKELHSEYEWRQQLQAYGTANEIKSSTAVKLQQWMDQKNVFISPIWSWLRILLPIAMLVISFLYLSDLLSITWYSSCLIIALVLSQLISRKVSPAYEQLNKIAPEINTLSNSISWVEKRPFASELLKKLQHNFIQSSTKASIEIKALKGILDRLDFRVNPMVSIPINLFFFWDLQQAIALEKWKNKNSQYILQWVEALGQIEALASLANVQFNHPTWTFPIITNEHGSFITKDLGHPLIAESKRVSSSFATEGTPQLSLITGSNMAGKSTFLRSVGINIVLAMMGAPVCASYCKLSVMRVISTMRITDNLEESTSTFYAELKKLKYIITAVNNKENVFLLLDEILRGTNSLDRHTGSHALINQLIRHNAVGMLATHDLELAKLSEEYPSHIHNYHFDVQVEKDELYFDYKLKEGVCKSLNASILMKKIGIEL